MDKEKSIEIAIAGLGFGELVHLPAARSNTTLKPVAIWHPSYKRLERTCKEENLKGYQEWAELLENPNIKGIIIATPPNVRYKLALEALNAGKHLLLEKPVALTSEEIQNLHRVSINNNLSVAVDFEYRAVPLFMQAKRILTEDFIGKPWLIKFDWIMSSRADTKRNWNWYSQSEAGGGVIGALGTHAFDILNWLIGPTISVSGLLSTSIKSRPINNDFDVFKEVNSEDIALAQLQIKNQNDGSLVPAQVTLSSTSREGRGCWIEIYGSQGTILIGSDNQKDYVHGFNLWVAKAGEKLRPVSPDSDLGFERIWADGRIAPVARLQSWWANSINNNSPVIPGLAEGFNSQVICDKLKESHFSSQRIRI